MPKPSKPARPAAKPAAPREGVLADIQGGPFAAVLAVLAFIAYRRVWTAGLIWDDNFHVTRPVLQSFAGLWRTWTEPGATEQYYPVLHSAFWVEHRLWGDAPLGYHVLNVALHVLGSYLLYRVLSLLKVPGARLAALAFALHPVCVESVAWVSEQKNTLSGVFYFAAALLYLRFDGDRRRSRYAWATALFVLALLSKSVTATLPAALLVVLWWKRGRLSFRGDVLPLLPWFALSAVDGTFTAWVERTFVGAHGASFDLGLWQRVVLAGRIACFYAGKILVPSNLTFIYPRWTVNPHSPAQLLYVAIVAAVLAGGLFAVRRTRAPLAVALLFLGTLAPALGFVNVYPFVYSYVADHFQYLAAAILISALCALGCVAARGLASSWRPAAGAAAAIALCALAIASSRQSAVYESDEAVWRSTLAHNPSSWMAHDNLGDDLMKDGDGPGGIAEYRKAIEIDPANLESWNDLGLALMQTGDLEGAKAGFRKVLELDRRNSEALNNLGGIFSKQGRYDEAIAEYREAEACNPNDEGPHYNLANALMRARRIGEAAAEYGQALRINPLDPDAHYDLGVAYIGVDRLDDAAAEFRKAIVLSPGNTRALTNLGAVLLKRGDVAGSIAEFQSVAKIQPDDADAHFNLAGALLKAERVDDSIAEYRAGLRARPRDSAAHRALGAALFKKGLVTEADAEFQESVR